MDRENQVRCTVVADRNGRVANHRLNNPSMQEIRARPTAQIKDPTDLTKATAWLNSRNQHVSLAADVDQLPFAIVTQGRSSALQCRLRAADDQPGAGRVCQTGTISTRWSMPARSAGLRV